MALIKHYLKRGEAFAWLDKAKELLDLQKQLNRVVLEISPLVAIPVTVMYYEKGEIHLGVPHQAWLVRIKNLSPKIMESLGKSGWEVNRIKCKMQIRVTAPSVEIQKRVLSSNARMLLDELRGVVMNSKGSTSSEDATSLEKALRQLLDKV